MVQYFLSYLLQKKLKKDLKINSLELLLISKFKLIFISQVSNYERKLLEILN